jgi:hypothetical protein
MRPCPSCGRRIQDAAPRCHYCNAAVPHVSRAARTSGESSFASDYRPPPAVPLSVRLMAVVVLLVVGLIVAFLYGR